MKRIVRRLHKWIGIVSCVFMLLVSTTALALNHRELWQSLVMHSPAPGFQFAAAKIWAADPHQSGHLLAADAHRLWQSLDGGQQWQELKLYVPAEDVSGLAFDPHLAGRIWVSLAGAGIYASDDGGEIWEELDLPFDPVAGERILGISAGAAELVVRTRFGAYRYNSADGSWLSQVSAHRSEVLSVQDWVWRLHTGRGLGPAGILVYDGISIALILLALSGLVLSVRPRRRPQQAAERIVERLPTELLK